MKWCRNWSLLNTIMLKIYTTLGYIVSLILLNLGHVFRFGIVSRVQEDKWNNITKSCVNRQFKMCYQEVSVETIKLIQLCITNKNCNCVINYLKWTAEVTLHEMHRFTYTSLKDHRDIWAGHLVAMTENAEDSIVLLDDRGCPTNLNVFPALTKISNNNTIKLIATFQAFKFSSSTVMRFSVILQFCSQKCEKVNERI